MCPGSARRGGTEEEQRGAERKVEQPRESWGEGCKGGGVTSHAAGKLSAPMSFHFCGWGAFFFPPVTHLLRSARTCARTRPQTCPTADMRRQLQPPRWPLSEGESDGGEPPVRRENSRKNLRLVAFRGTMKLNHMAAMIWDSHWSGLLSCRAGGNLVSFCFFNQHHKS